MGAVVDGVYYNTDSGLSAPGGFFDRLTNTVDQVAQGQGVLRGYGPALAATGVPLPAQQPGILSRILGAAGLAPPADASASPAAMPVATASGAVPGIAPAAAPSSPSAPASAALSYFAGKGMNPIGAAGLVGGLMRESGLNPGAANPGDGADGSTSGGIAQWNGPRAQALQSFAAQNGRSPGDLGTQLDFVWNELNGPERKAFAALQNAQNPLQATAAATGYERPAGWTPDNPTGAHDFGKRYAATMSLAGGMGDAQAQPAAGQASPPPTASAYAGPQGAPAAPASSAIGAAAPAGAPAVPMPIASASTHVTPSLQPPADGSAAAPQQPSADQVRTMVASADPATRARGMSLWQGMQQQLPPVGASPSAGSLPASSPAMAPPSRPAGVGASAGPPYLPPGMTPAALGAMIAEPATRERGLALWQSSLTPPAPVFGKPGDLAFVRGQPTYQVPFAPMNVPQGDAVYDPSTRGPAFKNPAAPIKLGPADTIVPATGGAPIAGNSSGTMDPETIESLARRLYSGDSSALTGISRGPLGAQNVAAIQARAAQLAKQYQGQPKPTFPENDILANAADQAGALAGARTSGEMTAKLDTFANEASNAMDLGIQASRAVPRTNWTPVNSALQKVQAGSGDPKLAQFTAANNAIINTYAKAINPSGVPTDSDKAHARDMLSTAQSPEAYEATVQQLQREVNIAHNAARGARAAERAGTAAAPISDAPRAPAPGSTSVGILGLGQGGSSAPPPIAAPAGASASGAMPTLTDPAQVRSLPSGTKFKTPDGRIGVAP